MSDFAQTRRAMVDCQLRTFDITNRALLAAMDDVPREMFVGPDQVPIAYIDRQIVVRLQGEARAMINPPILGRMIQALEVVPGHRVLDVAGGLGYAAAILSHMGIAVTLLETAGLAAEARARLGRIGAAGVEIVAGDLTAGHPVEGGYDAILVEGGVEERPIALLDQLADNGRLVVVDTGNPAPRIMIHRRSGDAFSARPLLEAVATTLPGFARTPEFTF